MNSFAESDHYGYSRRYLLMWIIKIKNKSEQFRRNVGDSEPKRAQISIASHSALAHAPAFFASEKSQSFSSLPCPSLYLVEAWALKPNTAIVV